MEKIYTIVCIPTSVCAKRIEVDVSETYSIKMIRITGGCSGQAKTLDKLLRGCHVKDAYEKLKGITCGSRGTSCSDQLSKALEGWYFTHPEPCVLNCDHCPEDRFDSCQQKFTRKIE